MAGWNTPARNAATNKRPCDQKRPVGLWSLWQGQRRSGGRSPTDLHKGCLRSSLMDVLRCTWAGGTVTQSQLYESYAIEEIVSFFGAPGEAQSFCNG